MADERDDRLRDLHDRLEEMGDEHGAADLRQRIGRYRGAPEDHEDLLERLHDAALRLEVSHPELSRLIAGVIDSLTASGI